jgi:hypothetical protein
MHIVCAYKILHVIHVTNIYFMKLNDIMFICFIFKDDKNITIHTYIHDDTKFDSLDIFKCVIIGKNVFITITNLDFKNNKNLTYPSFLIVTLVNPLLILKFKTLVCWKYQDNCTMT